MITMCGVKLIKPQMRRLICKAEGFVKIDKGLMITMCD